VKTDCPPKQPEFDKVGHRKWVAAFDANSFSSDGGLVLLHRADRRFRPMRKFAACFRDLRAPDLIHYSEEDTAPSRTRRSASASTGSSAG
jgi:hypothetical protein